jgi:hypothetical protein
MVANLGDFSPKKANFGIFLKNAQGIFYTNNWTFKVLNRFFKIRVGSTVFTVLPKMHGVANHTHFKFNTKNEFFKNVTHIRG